MMGRRVDVDELVSALEIVERLNLASREAVRSWRRRFPAPVVQLAIGSHLAVEDIETWAAATGHLRGRRLE